ncbi:MAG: SDR family NAD(P)-dependent oxidoreductase [Solirubrobacterales bacterium]
MVTGANAGLGRATSLMLAEGGARVVMVCRDREKGEEARKAVASVASLEPPRGWPRRARRSCLPRPRGS